VAVHICKNGYAAETGVWLDGVGEHVEFCLLGPLAVSRDGELLSIARGAQRAVLASLLLSAGRVVAADEIIEDVWTGAPPRTARTALHNYVMRLRRSLGQEAARIVTRPSGYQLIFAPAELDVARFSDLSRAGQDAASHGVWAEASAQLSGALRLWRGQPLVDIPSDRIALRELPRLEELRLLALEARAEAEINLGRHAQVIGELMQLVQDEPLRERAQAALMLALLRAGQRAGALAAYRSAHRALAAAGLEPGPGLQDLRQRILRSDPRLLRLELTARISA
jgi:DNA-binding SARP family transcriptional activator